MTDEELEGLRGRLRQGVPASEGSEELKQTLGIDADASDLGVSSRLIARLGELETARIAPSRKQRTDPRPVASAEVVMGADSSFLGRLRARADASSEGFEVETLEDPRTVLAVARAGTLPQRRAAVQRLGELLSADDRKLMSGEVRRELTEALERLRDVELAYELSRARAHLSGAVGREVRAERDQFGRIAAGVERRIRRYWDGDVVEEPITALPGDQRAVLLMRVRDLSDAVLAHLGAVLETDTVVDRDRRLSLLSSLRFAGDPRLAPFLIVVLTGADSDLAVEAARALGRIEDPRIHPALVDAYERAVVDRIRMVLAGSLGEAGDARGAEYVRQRLESDDAETIRYALEALETVGRTEDTDLVIRILDRKDVDLRAQAVRALKRLGEARALQALAELREQTSVSSLWAELEDAEVSIRARLELRGEEARAASAFPAAQERMTLVQATPEGNRFRGWKNYFLGKAWLALGVTRRAIARFELAAAARPGWTLPLVAIGMLFARRNRHAQALANFRRAVEADRRRVERTSTTMHALVRSFLRRAEEVEHDGRLEIARGLLEEALTLDLRRAPGALRFEVHRRYEAFRRRSGK